MKHSEIENMPYAFSLSAINTVDVCKEINITFSFHLNFPIYLIYSVYITIDWVFCFTETTTVSTPGKNEALILSVVVIALSLQGAGII